MEVNRSISLKNGKICTIRNAILSDAADIIKHLLKVRKETDFLYDYPEETNVTKKQEELIIKEYLDNPRSALVVAVVDERIVALSVLDSKRDIIKIRHRANLSLHVEKEYWNIGIGSQIIRALCLQGSKVGLTQIELEVALTNTQAIELYKREGFLEFGRNKRAMRLKNGEYIESLLMNKLL